MKRILSALLAVMLIATLLPTAAFATEGEANTGITIRYDVAKYISELGAVWESAPKINFKELNYTLTKGMFNYFSSSSATGDTLGSNLNWNTGVIQMSSGRNMAFEVFVPMAGTYKMNMYNAVRGEGATTTSVFMKKGASSTHTDNLIGAYNCYSATAGTTFQTVDTPNVIEDIIIPEAGYYVFTFKANSSYGSIGTFELVSGDGAGSVLASVTTKSERIMAKGNKIQFDPAFYMSDGKLASKSYDVSYESSDPLVAEVSASGLITALKDGETTITASVTNEGGYTLRAEKKVTVTGVGVSVFYDINGIRKSLGIIELADAPILTSLDYTTTNGFFDYVGTSNKYDGWTKENYNNSFRYADTTIQLRNTVWVAFELEVPEAGTYDLQIKAPQSTDGRWKANMEVYISEGGASTAISDFAGSYCFWNESAKTTTTKTIKDIPIAKKGKYVFTFKCVKDSSQSDGYQFLGNLTLTSGTNNALINGSITSTADTINVDEGESATVAASGYLSSTATAATFTYTSSNPAVAEVDATSGVVTPKKAGKVTIKATANDAVVANTLTTDITVTENVPGEAADTTVKVYIPEVTGGTVTVSGATLGAVSDVDFGDPVTVEAVAAEGYKFVYWKDNRGGFVSEEEKHTFKPYTNTSLIAVFDSVDAESDTTGVEFFDGNKTYLGFKEVTAGITFGEIQDKPAHGLFGFAPNGWSIDESEEINSLVRAVALYSEQGNSVSGISVNGEAKTASYDDAITETVKGAKTWYRDDKLVGYGETYTYLAWSGTAITSSEDDVAKHEPLAVLNKSGDAYMLEYDRGDCEIIEAGILFGNDTHKTVGSCYYKARVKNIKAHGQFTAKANAEGTAEMQSIARGYVIFKTSDGSIRVIYAD